MSKLIIMTCYCHKGNIYILNRIRIKRVVYECTHMYSTPKYPHFENENQHYKEITNIKDIVNSVLSNLT